MRWIRPATTPLHAALAGALSLGLVASAHSPQTPHEPPRQEHPIFRTATSGVMVDVVVRDGTGRPIMGLTQDDFEVLEDGVSQRIIGFAEMRAGSQLPDQSTGSSAAANLRRAGRVEAVDASSFVAVVFHQLSPQSRAMAVKAARSRIDNLATNEHLGLFVVDLNLAILSGFTRNTRELHAALDRVLRTPPPGASPAGGVAEAEGPAGRYLSRESEQAAEMRARLASGLEGPQQAAVQAASLADVVGWLARFSGRKAVILFSEGLAVSPRLESVVDRARSENVAFYTIYARGLETGRPWPPPSREIDARELTASSRTAPSSWSRSFPEMDPTSGLGPLARNTGGFLAGATNDLTAALSAIDADRRAFYLLAYVSSNEVLDGSTRSIEVRVKRPALSVRARHGYIAADPATDDRASFERPVLQALRRVPPPREFEVAIRGYRTPRPGETDLISVVVEVPGGTVEFRRDSARRRYTGELAVVTRILKDEDTVASQSQLYELTGDLSQLDQFSKRPLTYLRTATLGPGTYTLQAAVQDRTANRYSVAESTMTVTKGDDPALVAGDLIVVRNLTETKRRSDQQKANPLAWRGAVITPHLHGGAGAPRNGRLMLAIPLVVARGPVTGRLALARQGQPVAEIPVSPGKPERNGRLLSVMEFPVRDLPPGRYQVTLTLSAGGHVTQRDTTVILP
jgi:VWFA-related protein